MTRFAVIVRLPLWPLLAASLGACAGGPPRPTAADASRLGARWPNVALAELEQGRELYAGRCATCHELYEPARFGADRWPGEVRNMRERAKLNDEQELRIVRYLVSVADRSATRAADHVSPNEN